MGRMVNDETYVRMSKLSPNMGARPWHTCRFPQWTERWFSAQQEAFVRAMEANPDIRPVNYDFLDGERY